MQSLQDKFYATISAVSAATQTNTADQQKTREQGNTIKNAISAFSSLYNPQTNVKQMQQHVSNDAYMIRGNEKGTKN